MSSTPKLKGFAALSPERRRELASLGGKRVKPEQRSFYTNRQLAVEAGTKGGLAARNSRLNQENQNVSDRDADPQAHDGGANPQVSA